LVNATAVTNRETTPYQEFYDKVEPGPRYKPNLGHYRVIGTHAKALIPLKHRAKLKKLAIRTEPVRLLGALSKSTVFVYAPGRKVVYKTFTVKILKGVRVKNLVPEGDIFSKGVTQNLPKKSAIGAPTNRAPESDSESEMDQDYQRYPATVPDPDFRLSEPVTPTVRPPEKPTDIAPPTLKIPDIINKIPIFRDLLEPSEINPDAMEIDKLVQYICYKVIQVVKKKKPIKNGKPNFFKQALKSPNKKE